MTNIIWYYLYVKFKKYDTNKSTLLLPKGIVVSGRRGKIGIWVYHVHPTMYKLDKQQGPTV